MPLANMGEVNWENLKKAHGKFQRMLSVTWGSNPSLQKVGSQLITTQELRAEKIPEPLLWVGASDCLPVLECSQGLDTFEWREKHQCWRTGRESGSKGQLLGNLQTSRKLLMNWALNSDIFIFTRCKVPKVYLRYLCSQRYHLSI